MWIDASKEIPRDYKIVPVWAKTKIGKKKLYGYCLGNNTLSVRWYHIDKTPMKAKVLKWFDVPDPEEK